MVKVYNNKKAHNLDGKTHYHSGNMEKTIRDGNNMKAQKLAGKTQKFVEMMETQIRKTMEKMVHIGNSLTGIQETMSRAQVAHFLNSKGLYIEDTHGLCFMLDDVMLTLDRLDNVVYNTSTLLKSGSFSDFDWVDWKFPESFNFDIDYSVTKENSSSSDNDDIGMQEPLILDLNKHPDEGGVRKGVPSTQWTINDDDDYIYSTPQSPRSNDCVGYCQCEFCQ